MTNNARNSLINKPDSLSLQFIKYLFVAGAALLVDYILLFILTDLFNWFYLVSTTVSFTIALTVSYHLSIKWVFTKSSYNKVYEFVMFFLIGAIGLFANLLIMFYFTDLLKLHYMGSKIVSTVFIHFWNFFARKHILYK